MNKATSSKQLIKLVHDLQLFSHLAMDRLTTKDGSNMPFLVWPNGFPCILANLYMLSLRNRPGRSGRQGLSRRGSKGGSLGAYAFKISQLIRYCYRLKIELIELTDHTFTEFIGEIRRETSTSNPAAKKKNENTILSIGQACLDFLGFVGRFYDNERFVSTDGTIRITERIITILTTSGRMIKRSYLHHHSFSEGGRPSTRDPISEHSIDGLRCAIDKIKSSRHLQQRRHILISLLEHTGARRSEIANITLNDIRRAFAMKEPMLRLETWKQCEHSERTIPVTRMLLGEINKYIDFHRKKVLRMNKITNDHGFLFVSDTTGKPIKAESFTNEIGLLRKHAGITEQACAHMFRHAFITNLFILLIKRHKFQNPDAFNQALLTSKKFIAEVMQWTGHKDPTSVERYIHLAFAKISGYAETITSVHLLRTVKHYDQQHALLARQLQEGKFQVPEYLLELDKLQRVRDEDLEIAKRRTPASV